MDRRPGTDVQSHHTGLDQLLRSLLQVGALSHATSPRPAPCALGDDEIQTPEEASTAGGTLDPQGCLARSIALCSLAAAPSSDDWDGKSRMSGDVHVRICERLGVRFPRATRLVVGFNSKADADQFRAELTERMQKFNLELHPEKTRLLEFGPYAIDKRQWRGEGKPETFNFLGFTHICVKKRSNGRFTVLRQTIRKRLQTKRDEVKAELQRRMHEPIPEQGKWLRAVVGGHIRYYGVPMNQPALALFRFRVGWYWHRSLSRRSQNGRVLWDRMRRLIKRWLPLPTVWHPYPLRRMGVVT